MYVALELSVSFLWYSTCNLTVIPWTPGEKPNFKYLQLRSDCISRHNFYTQEGSFQPCHMIHFCWGLHRPFLSMYLALGIVWYFRFPGACGSFPTLIPRNMSFPILSSQAFRFVCGLPQLLAFAPRGNDKFCSDSLDVQFWEVSPDLSYLLTNSCTYPILQ